MLDQLDDAVFNLLAPGPARPAVFQMSLNPSGFAQAQFSVPMEKEIFRGRMSSLIQPSDPCAVTHDSP
jgi:hypothetical protein